MIIMIILQIIAYLGAGYILITANSQLEYVQSIALTLFIILSSIYFKKLEG